MDDQQQKQIRQERIRSIINFIQGIAATLFIFSAIIAIYLTVIYRARLTPFVNYAIVFDAGSSHTEMFVYHWPADKSDGLGTTSTVNEYFVCPLQKVVINGTVKNETSNDTIKNETIYDTIKNETINGT